MSGFSNPIIGGGGALVYPAIHSPNFVTTVSGWTINKDGTAEFNSVTIRGGVLVSGTSLYYSGTPAAGNLIASISTAAGTDPFGNPYQPTMAVYNPALGLWARLVNAAVNLGSTAAGTRITSNGSIVLGDAPADSSTPNLQLTSPGTAAAQVSELTLGGESKDASSPASWTLAPGGIVQGPLQVNGKLSTPAVSLGSAPADPAGTVSTTQVMMGLGSAWTLTPGSTGKTLVTITGLVTTATAIATAQWTGRFGTGTAPLNGVAVVGTRLGPAGNMTTKPQGIGVFVPFAITALLALTAGTAYWFDLALATSAGADAASFSQLSASLVEIR